MSSELYDWIRSISTLSPLIPLVCLLIYRKGQPKQNVILAVSLFISLIFDVVGFILAGWFDPKLTGITNNLYFIVAFPALMWFYHETLTKKSLKLLVRVFTAAFVILALIFALKQGIRITNFNTLTLSSILVTITSFFFVADHNLRDERSFARNPFHETNINLNTSLALYSFVTIVIFAVSDYVFARLSLEDAYLFWAGHNAINVAKNIGISVAFYFSAMRSKSLGEVNKNIIYRGRANS